MKNHRYLFVALCLVLLGTLAMAQGPVRTDAIWARSAPAGSITLDGKLDEAVWAKAESVMIMYGNPGPLPGGGYRGEGGGGDTTTDPTVAKFKFLVSGNELYIGVTVKDSSVTGGTWAKFDAFLGNIRRKSDANRPASPFEVFYGWVAEPWADTNTAAVGALPGYFGSEGGPRTPTSKWDAMTTVQGISNDDATADTGYTTEFKFKLGEFGYDVTTADGDIVLWSTSIWDSDWKDDPTRYQANRVWLQGPWGNAKHYNTLRIFAKPSVTTTSGTAPVIQPEVIIPNGMNHSAPVIDGEPTEAVWAAIEGVTVRFGDDTLRAKYPGAGALTSGQWQPEINGTKAPVVDPAEAVVKMFFKGDILYILADVNDQVVQAVADELRKDGFSFLINDRKRRDTADSSMYIQQVNVFVDEVAGQAAVLLGADGQYLKDSLNALEVGLKLKGGTTLDTLGATPDAGYWVEMAIDLRKIGYPNGRGDGVAFIGAQIWDGDSFVPSTNNYGTRTWWFRENKPNDAPAWAYMDIYQVIPGGDQLLPKDARKDVVWARTAPAGAITMDGLLNEPAWAAAESLKIMYGAPEPIPGSGYRSEGGRGDNPLDPTMATFKFLVMGNELYIAADVKDVSVTGGTWAKFDAFLGNIRRKSDANRPASPFEVFYGWVAEPWADTNTAAVGALPGYFGSEGGPRTPASKWDAMTVVNGTSNDDTTPDVGYTTEFKFKLSEFGYDVTAADGDMVLWSTSIWDSDYKDDPTMFGSNRVWLQGPWGNARHYNSVRIYAKPSVTTTSGALPVVAPEAVIPNGANHASPTIDGMMDENVWANIPGVTIRFGDDTLRATYPGAGALTSGQFQPELDGAKAPVIDPGEAVVKMFFKDDMLYIGADVNDQVVQVVNNGVRNDGFSFSINDRARLDAENNNLYMHLLTVFVDTNASGQVVPLLAADAGYLKDSVQALQVGLALKPGTVLDTVGAVPDVGYQIEMALDLKKLGYPAGRGDGVAFVGAQVWDGDSFIPTTNNYATRTWWFRENKPYDAPAWAYMDASAVVTGVDDQLVAEIPYRFELLGNYPNPFNPTTTIAYTLAQQSVVSIEIFDILGRSVATLKPGSQQMGLQKLSFNATNLPSGAYFYRVNAFAPNSGSMLATMIGKMMLIK